MKNKMKWKKLKGVEMRMVSERYQDSGIDKEKIERGRKEILCESGDREW